MAFIYITGISGSGKSTVRSELIRRGYEAYGTDEDGLAAFYHHETGERIDHYIFLCGVASNDEEVWGLFDKVIALTLDETTLRRRITERTNNDFGKVQHELDDILMWQKTAKEDYEKLGAIIVEATKSIKETVDLILKLIGEGK
jgi:dephospho-CoA kinase